ncbi:DUF5671 domain-containing protein [Cryobacterium psychrophilum]|uniref:DUF5671 domain-containing protein n=1 Tax=Cryobacterium psychrophilum TaxID=41988 RepID=A0A4Y8KQN3_9MICO|nr:DUF5671 domain-containing protein [Cryobacterium psychrophilum]TDW30752.1 hypothetical protein EDD25_2525 [Cryobacterium psychrophilum]TFD75844.1 hypothetical protein E3T53_15385 [Cryobacterium psychrophilum]
MSAEADSSAETTTQPTARRVVVFTLLFALVIIAAIGLAGLLNRLLDRSDLLVSNDVPGLARALAFTLIAGPLAAVLWWVQWRRLGNAERASVAWGLYVALMSTVSLIVFSSALLVTAAALVRSDWQPNAFATGLVWAGVWVWHRRMSRHADKAPTRLRSVAPVLGAVFGLLLFAGGALTALSSLIDTALGGLAAAVTIGDPWWRLTLQALLWSLGGAVVWWLHWFRDDARGLRGGLATVALIVVGIAVSVAFTLAGAGTVLYRVLRLTFDRTESVQQMIETLGFALAAAAIGALVWAYHQRQAALRSAAVVLATRIVTAAVGLIGAASGVGVIVTALLATLAPSFVGSDARTLLLGGLSALVVSGPAWWLAWKPAAPVDPAEAASAGRRLYLVLVFGLSAIAAIVTLLVIGYRLFESALGDPNATDLLTRVRAPLGLLVATGLVAGYHFAIWRRDRALVPARPPRRIQRIVLVAGTDPQPLVRALVDATGATVTLLRRADVPAHDAAAPTAEELARIFGPITAARVLVVAGKGGRLEVIPLQD